MGAGPTLHRYTAMLHIRQMAVHRIQVLLSREEKTRLQEQAGRDGASLSSWMRAAAIEKLEAARRRSRFANAKELAAFFKSTRARETGREPDWEQHVEVIDRSRSSGGSRT